MTTLQLKEGHRGLVPQCSVPTSTNLAVGALERASQRSLDIRFREIVSLE